MLDREVVGEFLSEELEEMEIELPHGIREDLLLETFCKYIEDDYYEWLKDNFESFFNHGDPDWDWIKDKARRVEQN
jgi:succinate dehydrogenase flavin-adding protein (antitoxin of CptAB toxin-antitoxin module)